MLGQVTIVLADDHEVIRKALRMLLESESAFEVVAEAGTAEDATRYVLGHKPTVLVLDINMPGGSAIDAIPAIKKASPGTEIVILTMESEPEFARAAMKAGARGYVLKEAAEAELVQAVNCAARGETYLQPSMGAKLASEPDAEKSGLSDRETEVLRLIALGHTNSEIAEQLFLSVRTVESHRAHIQQKLDLASRAELVRYALDHHVIDQIG